MTDSRALGQNLADYQSVLTRVWRTDGPDTVHQLLSQCTYDELLALAVCNVGRDASAS